MPINQCLRCKKQFEAGRKDKKYCSTSCRTRHIHGKAICKNCEQEFEKTGPDVVFCSKKCANNYNWEKRQPEAEYLSIRSCKKAQARFVTVKCGVCGKSTEKRVGDYNRNMKQFGQVFCGMQCAMIGTGRTVVLTCSECGKSFTRKKSDYETYNANGKYVFCSKECQVKNLDYVLRGESHYCYVNGKFSVLRGKGWRRTRELIRIRDNRTCQICGVTEEGLGKKLDVHHIIPYREFDNFEEANKPDNLISLCPSCHHKEENRTFKNKE